MKPYERRRALPRRRVTVTIELTPEEYETLVAAVLQKRQAAQDRLPADSPYRSEAIDPAHPLAHTAVEFDVQCELASTILKFIGHEVRPTLAAQYERMRAELRSEARAVKPEDLVRAA